MPRRGALTTLGVGVNEHRDVHLATSLLAVFHRQVRERIRRGFRRRGRQDLGHQMGRVRSERLSPTPCPSHPCSTVPPSASGSTPSTTSPSRPPSTDNPSSGHHCHPRSGHRGSPQACSPRCSPGRRRSTPSGNTDTCGLFADTVTSAMNAVREDQHPLAAVAASARDGRDFRPCNPGSRPSSASPPALERVDRVGVEAHQPRPDRRRSTPPTL